MIPLRDENPTLRAPVTTTLLLIALGAVWVFVQKAGLDDLALAASICDLGLVAGEITGLAPLGTSVPMGPGLNCVVDNHLVNYVTPLTSMFLHGSWGHLLANGLFLWVFGKGIEDSMGRLRYVAFYLLCGLTAAATQVAVNPAAAVPMVGASGAISGVMGAYLILYPRVRIHVFLMIFLPTVRIPAWLMLLWWIGLQIVAGLPELTDVRPDVSAGVAVWAHIGGFLGGIGLVKLFENHDLVAARQLYLRRYLRGFV